MTRNAGVFIIARDPAAPSPPIAVTRRQLSDLPTIVHLGDSESMVQGRNLSMFEQFELVARISLSGQPGAQSGDWYGSVIVTPAEENTVTLAISEQVP
jgi:cytochrome c-type biogenesis protein CcmH